MRYGCQFKMGLTGLKRSVTFAHLPFFSRSLDLSFFFLFQTCLWRAHYFELLEYGCFSCLIRTILLLFTDITFIIYLRPIFLPGDCRSQFCFEKEHFDLPLDTCRPPEWVLAPSAEGVITFGDLACVSRFGKIKFSLTFSCCASPLFPFLSLFFANALTNTWPEFGPPWFLLKEYLTSEF